MYNKLSAKCHPGILRQVLAASVLSLGISLVSAETYVLGRDAVASASFPISMTETSEYYSLDFSQEDSAWQLLFGFNAEGRHSISCVNSTNYAYLMIRYTGTLTNPITGVSLSSENFRGKYIKSVTVDASLYNSVATTEDSQTIGIKDGATVIASTSESIPAVGIFREYQPVEIAVNRTVSDGLGIMFTSTLGSDFAFRSITIEYSEVAGSGDPEEEPVSVPEVFRQETVPVGHALHLECDNSEAVIHYTTDGTEAWQEYDAGRGISFRDAGVYTLQYYATVGTVSTAIIREQITVVQPTGLAAARASNAPVTVTGMVCGRGDGYLLLGEEADCAEADCVAIETTDYPQLQTVTDGDSVSATGRATDRFGSDIIALGTISDVTVNGIASTPTSLSTVRVSAPQRQYYDLQGRAGVPSTSTRRILISPDGTKHLK